MQAQITVQDQNVLGMLLTREKGTRGRVFSVMQGWSLRLAAQASRDAPQGVTGDLKQGIAGSAFARHVSDTTMEAGYGIPASVPYGLWLNSGTDENGKRLPNQWFVPFKVAPELLQWAQRIAGMVIETRPDSKWGYWPAGLIIRRQELHFLEPPMERNRDQIIADLEEAAVRGPDS